MGMNLSSKGPRAPMAEINVTPLVDVMLVLLIIFMVAAPMMTSGVDITLPETQAKTLERPPDALVLTIDREQRLYLNGEVLSDGSSAEDVPTLLQTNARLKSATELFVEADATVPYGVVVKIFAMVKGLGIERVGLITNPEVLATQPKRRKR